MVEPNALPTRHAPENGIGADSSALVELLQNLIRFNTVNPPGDEAECAGYIAKRLHEAGIDAKLLGNSPQRLNLVARLPGQDLAPPFLMFGHLDVVGVAEQTWTHPPFAGILENGYIWGRGALDMKGGVAMMVSALIRLKQEAFVPKGDLILALLCDEENGGVHGAQYLVTQHAQLFRDVRHAISELGGFTLHVAGRRFYPVMISEKQRCSIRLTLHGPGGHGSLPIRGGAMAELARVLHLLDKRGLPIHVTPPTARMLHALAERAPFPLKLIFRSLSIPAFADRMLPLLGPGRSLFEPVLRNTVTPTIVRGGDVINVVPGEIRLDLDGRLLPAMNPEDLVQEVRDLVGSGPVIEVIEFIPGPALNDLALFDTLADILCELDPAAIPIPFAGSGVSDARFFSRLGIQTYGFTPMLLPAGINFAPLIHGADERIPVAALEFGTEAILTLLRSMNASFPLPQDE
jgi:acetylornithine deacetylase/succinyl-diaminopimelate desuccinylase-like protein